MNRYTAAGTLALALGLLAAPAAVADEPGTNKAQVEYHERLQLAAQSPSSSETNKALVEYQERLAMAEADQGAPVADASNTNKAQVEHAEMLQLAAQSSSGSETNKALVEYQERLAMAEADQGVPAPSDAGETSTGVSASVWQLVLSALAGAALGGSAVAAARSRKNKAPEQEPENQQPVAV